ncbi:MAG: DnaJ domain-containing protein [Planctomycetes bacterium]|nr:DnaJ domain-containing protein [Planctomycetota bacterium]
MLRSKPQYWYGRFGIGVLLIVVAGSGRVPAPLAVLLGFGGFLLALQSIAPLVRLMTRQVHAHSAWHDSATRMFERASLPRRIYYLLAAVAEADGPMSHSEREAVRHFVLERFANPIHVDEIRSWEAQPLLVNDRIGLAARIATGLDDSEIDTLFCWCCLVAFADGKFRREEHTVLQQVARGLGVAAGRARMLFHLARAQFLRGDRRGEHARAAPRVDARAEAFAVLGLPPDAKPDQIRRRHRELAKRFHPDAHANLGPAAQREATERFREIQRAYETLST